MPKLKDLTGQRFGRLTAIKCTRRASRKYGSSMWLCLCDCGKSKTIQTAHLINGASKSCGCLQREIVRTVKITHGFKGSRLYGIFSGMKERCYNPNDPAFPNYGGRGIKICKEWLTDQLSFFEWSMKNGYSKELSIDRIKNDKGYSPENCRWATRKEQSRNTRSNVFITINGVTKVLSDWAEESGIYRKTLSYRLKSGWDPIDAITIPPVIGRNQSNGRR